MRTIIETLLVNERGLAFDPVSGETYQLLGPALPLVKLLQQGADNATLLQFLLEEYNVDAVIARRDLKAFLRSLEEMKLWAMQKNPRSDLTS
jgi:PqqD family protein of HPr-rel-A system